MANLGLKERIVFILVGSFCVLVALGISLLELSAATTGTLDTVAALIDDVAAFGLFIVGAALLFAALIRE